MTTLQERSVLVIGATGGLGAAISRRLASEGAALTLHGRDTGRLESLGLPATLVTGDLRDADTATRAVAAALEAHGRLDGVVIASGVVAFGPVGELPDDVLLDLFLINTLGPIRVIRAALPHLVTSGSEGRSPFVVSAQRGRRGAAHRRAWRPTRRRRRRSPPTTLPPDGSCAGRASGSIDARPPHTETGLADRPVAGIAPRLPQGLTPDAVAARVVAAVLDDEKDLPSSAFA